MRAYPLTVLQGGINRLRVKGGASANNLYDLQNGYITNAGSVVPREGTIRAATLDSSTVGLAVANGQFNIFSSAYSTAALPANYVLNVLSDPSNSSASPTIIWYAKPFMGFLYVVAQFNNGNIVNYWLQNNGTWTSTTDYTSASIVLPPTANGLAYQGVRDWPSNPLWTPDTIVTSGSYIEPNTPTGFAYQAIAVAGSPVHTGLVEPVWPTVAGGIIQEFGDFDLNTTDAGTTQGSTSNPYSTASPLGSNITDRYGDSATIANAGIFTTASSTLSSLTLASTKVNVWKAGTLYAPGSVVIPTSSQGAFTNAIPNGDFEGGSGAGGWTFTNVGGTATWGYSSFDPYQGSEGLIVGGGSYGTLGARATMTSYSLVTPGQSVTASAYLNPNNSGANLTMDIILRWYNSADSFISESGFQQNNQEGFGYRKTTITAIAPAGAAHVRVALAAGSGGGSPNNGFADLVTWNLETPSPASNFLYEAIQPTPGSSAATEPVWPTTLDGTVIDGTVTWEAIGTSIITWQAIPLMQSGLNAPTFPTVIGNTVYDSSSYTNLNGYITTFTSMSWEAVSRAVIDTNCPNTTAVTIGASHVFEGSNDIVSFSAAVNPIDWTSTNNAGYLPTGLNNYGDNPVAVLALYRGNLIAFNAGGYQMWQIDPDPQNMALLDAQPVGSIWTRAAQSVANDLIFLTEVGVRNLGTIGATANMAIGNTGQAVDPLIQAQLPQAVTIVAGDPYYSDVALLLGANPLQDSSSYNNTISTNTGVVTTTTQLIAGVQSAQFNGSQGFTLPVLQNGPLDLSIYTSWTIEFWIQTPVQPLGEGSINLAFNQGTLQEGWELLYNSGNQNIVFDCNGNVQSATNSVTTGSTSAVAITFNSGNLAIYINGQLSGTSSGTSIPEIGTSSLYFGGGPYDSVFFRGLIANYRITTNVVRYTGSSYTVTTSGPFPSPAPTYSPISLYYPGRGQYWLIFGPQAFVLTINGTGTKSWSRYLFPWIITDWTLNAGTLYFRTSTNLVMQLSALAVGIDDSSAIIASATNIPFNGVMQWPYLDMGSLGINKMLYGVDIVGNGNCGIQIAFNQNDNSTFNDNANFATSTGVTTPAYYVQIDDTIPGEPLAFPINAPSYSPILTFTGSSTSANAWTWQGMNIYFMPAPLTAGGATG